MLVGGVSSFVGCVCLLFFLDFIDDDVFVDCYLKCVDGGFFG